MSDADDLLEAEIVETVTDELGRAFGGKALTPSTLHQPIAHFDVARRRTILEAVPADECAGVPPNRMPDAKAVPASVIARDARQRRFDFFLCRRLAAVDVLHHARIAVEPHQVVEVVMREFAQVEAQRLHPGPFHSSRFLAPLGMTNAVIALLRPMPPIVRPGT